MSSAMTEPPQKRARRPDSKQMWDEADRRAPVPSRERERDEPRDRRDDRRSDDRNRDRDRRYRSRSPRDSRAGRDRGADRGERERERDYRGNRDSKGGGRVRDETGGRRNPDRVGRRDEGRDRDRERDGGRESRDKPRERSRDRARDSGKRDTRSRSPRRDKDRGFKKDVEVEKETAKPLQVEEDITERRTATPPVSFKVGGPSNGQDHDRMDVDGEVSHLKKKGIKVKKDKVEEEPVEEDEEIVIEEDDDMAAMQAMMGFGGFGTTHQKKVAGNDVYAVRKEKKTEYRQYMNRVGGFNRPLSPPRE